MRRKLVLLATALAVAGLVMASMSLTSAASPRRTGMGAWDALRRFDAKLPKPQPHDEGRTLVVVRRATDPLNFSVIDVNGRGFTVGDYAMVRERLFDRTGKRRVGVLHTQCFAHFLLTPTVVTDVCNVDATLYGRGHIAAYGRLTFREAGLSAATFSVIGGTGRFQDVRGELHFSKEEQGVRLIFHLLP